METKLKAQIQASAAAPSGRRRGRPSGSSRISSGVFGCSILDELIRRLALDAYLSRLVFGWAGMC